MIDHVSVMEVIITSVKKLFCLSVHNLLSLSRNIKKFKRYS